ncbi:MAG: FeoA family protein [Sphingobium sp.]
MYLHQLPIGQPAYVDRIDWIDLALGDAQRLREFGFDEGVSIETMHRGGLFRKGVLACRVGRMTVALRREHADAIHVRTGPEQTTRSDPKQS